MPILYKDAIPYLIPESEVSSALKAGFRRSLPAEVAIAAPAPVPPPSQTEGLIDVNSCSTKQLIDLPGVGVAIAKKVIANRPYQSVDDMADKLPDTVDWYALANRFTF